MDEPEWTGGAHSAASVQRYGSSIPRPPPPPAMDPSPADDEVYDGGRYRPGWRVIGRRPARPTARQRNHREGALRQGAAAEVVGDGLERQGAATTRATRASASAAARPSSGCWWGSVGGDGGTSPECCATPGVQPARPGGDRWPGGGWSQEHLPSSGRTAGAIRLQSPWRAIAWSRRR